MKIMPLLIVALRASSQQTQHPRVQSIPRAQRVSLEIESLTVWLGMTKQELQRAASAANMTFTDLGDTAVAFQSQSGSQQHSFSHWQLDR